MAFFPAPLFSAKIEQDVKTLFSSAQTNFELGLKSQGEQRRVLMIKAAGQFQSLVEDHQIENGHLYYNMGNAYYEAGEVGKAILSYRRAEKLLPSYSDLQYNLIQARSLVNVKAHERSWVDKIVKGMAFWHYMIGYKIRRNLFFMVFTLTWVFLATMVFKRHIFLRMGLILTIVLSLGFGGSYLLSYYNLHVIQAGVVTAGSTTARKGPGSSYESFYQKPLPEGTEFVIREKRDAWLKVQLSSGDEMWIKRGNAGII